ncbi:MAG: hypothetical protein CMD90_02375 [Gammaproteobacteria bacterium]|nr:hypothetical protein [Gammaproteobacteria bacterium]
MFEPINYIISFLYIITSILIWKYLSYSFDSKKFKLLIMFMWSAALLVHIYSIYPIFIDPFIINLSLLYALIIVSLFISIILFFLSFKGNFEYMGMVVLPIIGLIFILMPETSLMNIKINNLLFSHVVISLISYSIICLCATQAFFLKLQEGRLQRNNPSTIVSSLPPLETMDILLFKFLVFGVISLSISLLSGFLFLENIFSKLMIEKTSLSLLAWIIFVYLLFGRLQYGWRGEKAANITLVGFAILFLAYFGTRTFLEVFII